MISYLIIYSVIANFIEAIFPVILLVLKLFGINYYIINNRQAYDILDKINPIASKESIYGKEGLFISKYGIGNIHAYLNEYSVVLLTTKSIYESLLSHGLKIYSCDIGKTITIKYNKIPNESQVDIIDDIILHYTEFGYARWFIHGKPGAGKTTISKLITNKLDGICCDDYLPKESFPKFMQRISVQSNNAPIIVCVNEVDQLMEIITNADTKRRTTSKMQWNNWLDSIESTYGCILIMTSNVSPDNFTDTSLLASHRVDKIVEM